MPAGPWPGFAPTASLSAAASSANDGYPASNAVDGQVTTLWHSSSARSTPAADLLTMDFGASRRWTGLTYQPRLDGDITGTITGYTVEVEQRRDHVQHAAPAGTWPQDAR